MGRWTRWKVPAAASLSMALVACSNDRTLAPHRLESGASESAARQLIGGTFSLPVPANSDAPLEGGAPWLATGVQMRRGVNVRMLMPGTMTGTWRPRPNPPPQSSCGIWALPMPLEGVFYEVDPNYKPHLGTPYESLGAVSYRITLDAAGTVEADPRYWGAWNRAADGSWTHVMYHGDDSPDSGYISLKRDPIDGVCEGWIKYDLSGSQTITVDFPELDISTDRAFVLAGASVRFTSSATGFSPAVYEEWEWHGAGQVVEVAVCQNQSSCDYSPTSSGYMMLMATDAANNFYGGQSDSVKVVSSGSGGVILTCSNPVLRGASVSCAATPAPPATNLTVTGWSFQVSGSNVGVDRIQNQTSTSWGGVLVIAGTILVQGIVDGTPSFGTAAIQVTARNWSLDTMPKSHTVETPRADHTSRPGLMENLGRADLTLPIDTNTLRWLSPTISDEGPNHGFGYLLALPPKPTTISGVNTRAINDTSSFYRVQEAKRKKIGNLWYCPKNTVTGVLEGLVLRHEGSVPEAELGLHPNSHATIYRRHADSAARVLYESLAAPIDELTVTAIRDSIHESASRDSDAMHNDGRNYVTYASLGNCETFHFNYSQLPP